MNTWPVEAPCPPIMGAPPRGIGRFGAGRTAGLSTLTLGVERLRRLRCAMAPDPGREKPPTADRRRARHDAGRRIVPYGRTAVRPGACSRLPFLSNLPHYWGPGGLVGGLCERRLQPPRPLQRGPHAHRLELGDAESEVGKRLGAVVVGRAPPDPQ